MLILFGASLTYMNSWRMSIVLLSMFPAIGLAGALVMVRRASHRCEAVALTERQPAQTKGKQVVLDHLSRAGTLAEEAISSIRTVQAYNARERLARLYDEPNDDALQAGRRIAIASGVGIGGFIVRFRSLIAARACLSAYSSSSIQRTLSPSGGVSPSLCLASQGLPYRLYPFPSWRPRDWRHRDLLLRPHRRCQRVRCTSPP